MGIPDMGTHASSTQHARRTQTEVTSNNLISISSQISEN